jgi:hypothetical protein
MWTVLQVFPDTRGPQIAHVCSQWVLALQVPHLQPGVQQAHQPEESPVSTHR